ncbi:peptidase inhibitor family I36 protein [Allorhizocola rhizosphaerae]|uniref:peptidase inhibitor family I36 protein n=1 Tax=Allorhizocola rhizosphaerae TaxID=1872709 RepID=UPI000E3E48F4|nr:peptidase inhibitor family I36 protein [Allorhizocola rhizosphaerae]
MKLARFLLTAVCSVALAVVAAPAPALAYPPAACPFTNTLCLFDQPNYGGNRFTVSSITGGPVCVDLVAHGWGGRARSAINTHYQAADLYGGTDCTGSWMFMYGRTGYGSIWVYPNSVRVH